LAWAVTSAGKAKVIIAGGSKTKEKALLNEVKNAVNVGVIGVAIGRNIWQNESPIKIAEKLKGIIWKK